MVFPAGSHGRSVRAPVYGEDLVGMAWQIKLELFAGSFPHLQMIATALRADIDLLFIDGSSHCQPWAAIAGSKGWVLKMLKSIARKASFDESINEQSDQ